MAELQENEITREEIELELRGYEEWLEAERKKSAPYLVLFSPKQGCFHVEEPFEGGMVNLEAILEDGFFPDYIQIGSAQTYEEASVFIASVRDRILAARDKWL